MSEARAQTEFRTTVFELSMLWLLFASLAALGVQFLVETELRSAMGSPHVANAIGAGILALVAACAIGSGAWRRHVEIAVGPDGLFIRDRTRGAVPWSEIARLELGYDPKCSRGLSLELGWVLVVHVRDPERWMTPRQRRRLQPDGSFSYSLSDVGSPGGGASVHESVASAIAPYARITRAK